MNCRYLSWTLTPFNSRNFSRRFFTFWLAISRTSFVYFALLEVLPLKDLETKLGSHNHKEVVSVHYVKAYIKVVLKTILSMWNLKTWIYFKGLLLKQIKQFFWKVRVRQWKHYRLIVNFKKVSLIQLFLLLTLNKEMLVGVWPNKWERLQSSIILCY